MRETIRQYVRILKNADRSVKLFFYGILFSYFGLGMNDLIFNLYLRQAGFQEDYIGDFLAVVPLAIVCFSLPMGMLGTKYGRKKIILIGMVGQSIFHVVRILTLDPVFILVATFFLGVFRVIILVNSNPFLVENTGLRERIHFLSAHMALYTASMMLGSFAGGFIPDMLSFFRVDTMTTYHVTIWISSFAFLISCIPIMMMKTGNVKGEKLLKYKRSKNEIKTILKFAPGQLFVGLGAGLAQPFMNIYLKEVYDFSNTLTGTIMSVNQVVMALAIMVTPILVSYHDKVKTLGTLLILSVPLMAGVWIFTVPIIGVLAYWIRSAFTNMGTPIAENLLMDAISDEARGTAVSVMQLSTYTGWIICPMLGGRMIQSVGYGPMFLIAGGCYLLASLYYLIVFRFLPDRKKRLRGGA